MADIKIVVSTHQGKLYDEICDYLVVHNENGEFAIFPNHVPVCTSINIGYVKLVTKDQNYFLSISHGLLEFHDNVCNVVAQEAHIGSSAESAKEHIDSVRKEHLENNRKKNADYTMSEKEIRKNLKNAGAGSL